MKKCNGCPILVTSEEGDINGNTCLPSYSDVSKWYNETGKVWSCHEKNTQPCVGFISQSKKRGIELNLKAELITEYSTLEEIYKT